MISSLKNDGGFIYAYIEWSVVNDLGQHENFGKFVWINDVWIHGSYRKKEELRNLIKLVYDHEFTQNSQFVYWSRGKYSDRQSLYLKKRFKRS